MILVHVFCEGEDFLARFQYEKDGVVTDDQVRIKDGGGLFGVPFKDLQEGWYDSNGRFLGEECDTKTLLGTVGGAPEKKVDEKSGVVNVYLPPVNIPPPTISITMPKIPEQKAPIVNVDVEPPVVNVEPPVVNVEPPVVNVEAPPLPSIVKKTKKVRRVERDNKGLITRIIDEER